MARPIVIAHHLVWTAYGWWLANDPRGSGSHTLRRDTLAELGELHHGRKRIQPGGEDVREFYDRAKDSLQHPLLTFDDAARDVIGTTFADVIACERYTCYACAVMPDHVHILIRKHKHAAEQMIQNLQRLSRLRLSEANHRDWDHPIWTSGFGWKVFLDHPDEVRRAVRYVDNNPRHARLPEQRWPFVTAYDGWPLHPGHSADSPCAKRLKPVGRYPDDR